MNAQFKDNSLSQAQVIESLLSAKGDADHIRVYRRLYCRVMEGRNLPAMDITGTSDPYCRVMVRAPLSLSLSLSLSLAISQYRPIPRVFADATARAG